MLDHLYKNSNSQDIEHITQNNFFFILFFYIVFAECLDTERRHMAALTWDAMFKSRRAAILADGGGVI